MPPPRSFLQTLLQCSRQRLLAPQGPIPPLVFGNESADLDSFVSAVLYSALSPSQPQPQPVPFFAVPRADLTLRPELLHLLSRLRIEPVDVICADDSPTLASLAAATATRSPPDVHIVDHNRLTQPFAAESVKGIIDHHDDEGLYRGADPRVVTKAGSCASLVVEQFFEGVDASPAEKRELAVLALAAILIDTANMTSKVTAHDEAAVALLERVLAAGGIQRDGEVPWDREAFYRGIYEAKQNVDALSLRDLLRKDYKEWAEAGLRLGISSVVKEISWMRGREQQDGFLSGLQAWGEERGLDVLSVMTTAGQGSSFRRELLVWAVQDRGQACVKLFGERAAGVGLKLMPWNNGELDTPDGARHVWRQEALAMSRKQVAPLLRECLRAAKIEAKV